MEASQQPRLEALSRFLVDHEPCGEGFDIAHPAGVGGGTIAMTCRGCGERYEHTTLTLELEREIEFEPLLVAPGADARPDPEPEPAPDTALDEDRDGDGDGRDKGVAEGVAALPPPSPRRRGGRTRDRAITAGLLLFAAAAIAFVVVRESHDQDSGEPAVPAAAAPRAPAKPAAPAHRSATTPAPAPTRLVATERFTLRVPRGWTRHEEAGDSLVVAPPGAAAADASVQVFYEDNPSLSLADMSAATATFLRSRPPHGAISQPRPAPHHGAPAFELDSRGRTGSRTALGVLADPYRYLVVASTGRHASPPLQAATKRVLASFRPR